MKNQVKYLIVSFTAVLLLTANAAPFFSDQKATTEEEKKQQQEFNDEWKKVDGEREKILNSINTNHVAPQVTEYKNNNIDIEAIAKKYEKGVTQQQAGQRVYVFVTLDMPKATLKKLATDVRKLDGSLVLRGFYNGSYKKTYEKIAELELSDGNIQVNPEAFHKYKISQAPSFVVVKKLGTNESLDLDGCVIPSEYIKIAGDVSLDYALEKMLAGVKTDEDKTIIKHQLGKLS